MKKYKISLLMIVISLTAYFFINAYSKPYIASQSLCKAEPYTKVGKCLGYSVPSPDAMPGCSATDFCFGIFAKGEFIKENKNTLAEYCPISETIDVSMYDLTTVAGRQAHYDFLLTKRACEVWNIWDAAIARANPNELSGLVVALGHDLSTDNSSDEMYSRISSRLYDNSRSVTERMAVIDTLMFAKSPLAVEHLFRFVTSKEATLNTGNDTTVSEVSDHAIDALKEIYMTFVNGSRNWSLSNVFEDAWLSIDNNEISKTPKVIRVVGDALGYLSKPSGVELLISTMASTSKTSTKYEVAMNAVSELTANDSVETVLVPALITYKDNQDVVRSVISGLVSIDSADSAIAILQYLDSIKNSNPSYYKLIKSEILKSKNDEVKKVVAQWVSR